MSESKLQVSFINWMRSALPDVLVWHTYNENAVNQIQGKIRKDRGVLAGVHDNCILYGEGKFATLELKDPDKPKSANRYSEKQQAFAERLDKFGIPHACCQSGEQIEAYILSLGLKPKYPFPRSLDSSKKQMLFQEIIDAMKP
jgi:hypothetical protein